MSYSDTAQRIRKQHVGKVPCIVTFQNKEYKFILPKDLSLSELMIHLRARMKKQDEHTAPSSNKAIFLLTKSGMSPTGVTTMAQLDDMQKGDFIELNGRLENVFG